MAVRFKLVDNRTRISKKLKELEEKLEQLQPQFLKETVETIVAYSPVDTGTYMDAHNVGVVGEPVSSKGKPRNQPYGPHAQAALVRTFAQIETLPDGTNAYISNSALHAPLVEYERIWAPYTEARAQAPAILERVKAKLGLK